MSSPKVIVALAPTSGSAGPAPWNPLMPERIREEVRAAADEGAALVHLHSRDPATGALRADPSVFRETCAAVRASCDVILEASTGGLSELSAAERAATLLAPEAETASLNMGSLNFGDRIYPNPASDVRFWLGEAARLGKKAVMELFDTGMLEYARACLEGRAGLAPSAAARALGTPLVFNFVFDFEWGMAWSPELLLHLRSRLPQGALWGCVFANHQDLRKQAQTLFLGASMARVGFEDSRTIEGRDMPSNASIVRSLVRVLRELGFEPASPSEARALLGLGTPLGRKG